MSKTPPADLAARVANYARQGGRAWGALTPAQRRRCRKKQGRCWAAAARRDHEQAGGTDG